MLAHVVILVAIVAIGDVGYGDHRRATAGPRMTLPTIPLRVAPPLMFGSRRALQLIERNLYVYRHGWIVIVSGFFEPLFYLLGIGFGLGRARRQRPRAGWRGDPVPAVRRAGAPRQLGDERRDHRGDVQRLLQAALPEDVRRDPGDAAVASATSPLARSAGR